jgi:hypothetical protein
MIMKSLIAGPMGAFIMLLISSCATVPKEPLASGELRLLSMDVVGSGVEANTSFPVNVFLRQPVIQRLKELVSTSQGKSHPVLTYRLPPLERRGISRCISPV